MSAALYIRVSSPKGRRIDSQCAELETWHKRQRLKTIHWFEDRYSATNLQRPAFQELQNATFKGEIDTVVVGKLDRLLSGPHASITVHSPLTVKSCTQ
ncbi:MAG: recombinase family protein [Nitrospira sp.]|nr:MAG: recombinase family protein [Nitrospira sp.]